MSQPSKSSSRPEDPQKTRPAFSIRAATMSDVPAILSLEQSVPSAAHWGADHYLNRIQGQSQSACLLVAEFRDSASKFELSGFLCARIVVGEWEIENVVVHPALRRQGIGAQLMRSLIGRSQEQAGTAILLEVRESNHAARALYERHGFREFGRRPAYYREPVEAAVLYRIQMHPIDGSGRP
jgi:[ribosomal protein S18]-alanine N-acetyltransferase